MCIVPNRANTLAGVPFASRIRIGKSGLCCFRTGYVEVMNCLQQIQTQVRAMTNMTRVSDVPRPSGRRTTLAAENTNFPDCWRQRLCERRGHDDEERRGRGRRGQPAAAAARREGGITCGRTLMRQIRTNLVAPCFERRPRGLQPTDAMEGDHHRQDEWAQERKNRLPSFTEVLSRRTRPPVDLFMF